METKTSRSNQITAGDIIKALGPLKSFMFVRDVQKAGLPDSTPASIATSNGDRWITYCGKPVTCGQVPELFPRLILRSAR